MDSKRLDANRTYPTFSGGPSTDRAVWGLSVVLSEIVKNALAKE
jgi:hypothetical protein